MKEMVTLKCSHKGCPRTRKVFYDNTMPKGTVVIKSLCPWHDEGDFGSEKYYNKDGDEMFYGEDGESKKVAV